MTMAGILRVSPVIPVVVIEDADDAVPLAQALVAGGVKVIEITLRSAAALDAVRAVSLCVHEMVVGVGTVTRAEEFAAAAEAGARFIVSPGVTDSLLAAAEDTGLNYLPGVMTPSEVIRAREAGLSDLKLFPAEAAGGIALLRALAGPFADITFCPTGGITEETAPAYLALPNVGCVGGSWLTPKAALAAEDWPAVTALARAAASLRPDA
jgi:2-dehydro-3-deoxyphosphogluconate aldolase/(4S)-4-hydroxy-2-oxoglutarate aldolase